MLKYNPAHLKEYISFLQGIGSLSNLFSESKSPYLHYRIAENLYCRVFEASNLSRGDISYDAKYNGIGIGLKTFLKRADYQFEKVAEFNALGAEIKRIENIQEKVRFICSARNDRIHLANRICGTEEGIYHCVTRSNGKIEFYETDYPLIDLENLKITKNADSGIHFNDGQHLYTFNFSKSTLFKNFYNNPEVSVDVTIEDDPFNLLIRLLEKEKPIILTDTAKVEEELALVEDFVILPLYSPLQKKLKKEPVPEKSQLNQWNAGGRARSYGEVYISIPAIIHKLKPGFFPPKEEPFNLLVPSGETLKAKVCQAGNKALMTNPNDALANWLLQKTLNLREGELLTYNRLKELGIDSVIISKLKDDIYSINFRELGSFEDFISSIAEDYEPDEEEF